MRLKSTLSAIAIGSVALLAGCTATDPLLSENNWHPTGANEMNIAAQVVNPMDLRFGRAPTGDIDGELPAAAVQRLRTGHVKALPDSAISDLKVQGSASSSGGQ